MCSVCNLKTCEHVYHSILAYDWPTHAWCYIEDIAVQNRCFLRMTIKKIVAVLDIIEEDTVSMVAADMYAMRTYFCLNPS